MDSSRPLQSIDPRPISTPHDEPPFQRAMPGTMPDDRLPRHPSPGDINQTPYQPPDYRLPQGVPHHPESGLGLHQGPEAHIPERPASANRPYVPHIEYPSQPVGQSQTQQNQQYYQQQNQQQYQQYPPPPTSSVTKAPKKDLKNVRATCVFQMREYLALRNRITKGDNQGLLPDEMQAKLRNQAGLVVLDLKMLQAEMREVTRKGESHRWRKWIVGGILTSFIPLVRQLFRRQNANSSRDPESQLASNDTEYAFWRASGLLSRIKDSVLGRGGALASIAFFVFAVLYVFQNEVRLRVARTIRKRVRKLCAKLEAGDGSVEQEDLAVFEGWRWRIVL